ncbi:T9SS type A sorting domain-containing protein [Polaribacter porphyrae]|uniref:Secretion system C-terminal sorting domain-containing protein n=1 Tax=Polaribacter porphyrae TaxID=1137780 RepID=A0A2S7WLZ3_9FLAO|nr:T9SS type A sorting domain-containing protein [Polaribacter porphyrae]PQJ78628.1 hypothetical protein BTO18_05245 [Polaribacter porphyrae]
MKKILLLITLIVINNKLHSQCTSNISIPDTNFKVALLAHGSSISGIGVSKIDINNDGVIQCSEATNYTGSINVINKNISDFTGLEQFPNITRLFVGFNSGTTLDVTANTKLILINANSNSLSNLDVSKNVLLESLSVEENNLTTVDVTANSALTILNFRLNSISTIDLSKNIILESLYFARNNLINLDISANINLKTLNADYNSISSLSVTNNLLLETLQIQNNSLTNLDLSQNQNLITLNLRNNKLKNLDASNNPNLVQFISDNNPDLESLNVANGNNVSLTNMWTNKTPKLTCIQHDSGFDPTSRVNGRLWIKDDDANWSDNCSATASITNFNKIDISIYPNPATKLIQIEVNTFIKKGIIYNWIGQKVKTFKDKNIDVSNLNKGVYLLKIETESGKIGLRKMIKK